MSLSKALMRDDTAARWLRRVAPLLLLIGLLAAVLAPGIINELRNGGAPSGAAGMQDRAPTSQDQARGAKTYALD